MNRSDFIREEKTKEELEKQLEKVKRRLEVLDMIDERLFEMKRLTKKVIDEDLTKSEIKTINKEVQKLEQETKLLQREDTRLS